MRWSEVEIWMRERERMRAADAALAAISVAAGMAGGEALSQFISRMNRLAAE